jgi:hypothetical protein
LVRPVIRQVQGGIAAQFADQVQAALPRQLAGWTVAKMPIQHQIGQREPPAEQAEQCLDPALNALQFGGQGLVSLGLVLAAFGPTWLALGASGLGLFRRRFGFARRFLGVRAHHLVHAEGKGAALRGADQCQAKKGQPGHRFLGEAGEEAIEAEGLLARLGDHDLIPHQQIDVVGLEKVLAKEAPKELRPREGGGEKALHGAVTPARTGPARDAQHGDPARHGQEGQGNPTQLADGRHGQAGLEAEEQC